MINILHHNTESLGDNNQPHLHNIWNLHRIHPHHNKNVLEARTRDYLRDRRNIDCHQGSGAWI